MGLDCIAIVQLLDSCVQVDSACKDQLTRSCSKLLCTCVCIAMSAYSDTSDAKVVAGDKLSISLLLCNLQLGMACSACLPDRARLD